MIFGHGHVSQQKQLQQCVEQHHLQVDCLLKSYIDIAGTAALLNIVLKRTHEVFYMVSLDE